MMRRIWIPVLLGIAQGAAIWASRFYDSGFPLYLAVGTLAFLAAVTPAIAGYNGVKAHQARIQVDAQAALLAVLTKIVNKTHLAAEDLGLHAYLVRRMWWPFWRKEQVRIARVRIASSPPPSTIVWTKGKGAVGQCWDQESRPIYVHLSKTHADYLNCSELDWISAPPNIRMSLSYEEWKTAQRYAGIIVVPIVAQKRPFGRYKYRGCVSLDCLKEEDYAELTNEVEMRKYVEGNLLSAAETIRVSLSTPA